MARSYVLVTVTGPDQPGITAQLTGIIADTPAQLLEIEQVVVQGRLTLPLLLSLESDQPTLPGRSGVSGDPARTAGRGRPRTAEAGAAGAGMHQSFDVALRREGLFRRSKRLVVMDMDSTLIRIEVISAEELQAVTAGFG